MPSKRQTSRSLKNTLAYLRNTVHMHFIVRKLKYNTDNGANNNRIGRRPLGIGTAEYHIRWSLIPAIIGGSKRGSLADNRVVYLGLLIVDILAEI